MGMALRRFYHELSGRKRQCVNLEAINILVGCLAKRSNVMDLSYLSLSLNVSSETLLSAVPGYCKQSAAVSSSPAIMPGLDCAPLPCLSSARQLRLVVAWCAIACHAAATECTSEAVQPRQIPFCFQYSSTSQWDKVYALLGLVNGDRNDEGLEADYSKTVVKLYVDVLMTCKEMTAEKRYRLSRMCREMLGLASQQVAFFIDKKSPAEHDQYFGSGSQLIEYPAVNMGT